MPIKMLLISIFLISGLFFGPRPIRAQGDPSARMSQKMQRGIELFNQGKHEQAMDYFMDVLVQGHASEKSLANEYLNRITSRIGVGEEVAQPYTPQGIAPIQKPVDSAPQLVAPVAPMVSPAAAAPQTLKTPAMEVKPQSAVPAPQPVAPAVSSREEKRLAVSQELVKEHIASAIRKHRENLTQALRKVPGIKVSMQDATLPEALSIPSELLFEKGVSFRISKADRILYAVAGLIYTLGDASVQIWPEHSLTAEPELEDLRRAMAVSSYLTKVGISPARIQVNLSGGSAAKPKNIQEASGVVVHFLYGRNLSLAQSSNVEKEKGPVVSLGVFPNHFLPDEPEKGAIIEFSALEPSQGLSHWEFELWSPGPLGPESSVLLQSLKDQGPVFHQIFWNGRKDFVGEPFQYGRYICVFKATDLQGRQSTLRRLVVLDAPKKIAEAKKPEDKQPAVKKPEQSKASEPSQKKAPPEAIEEENLGFSAVVSYRITFKDNKVEVTPEGLRELEKAYDTLSTYSLAKITLMGYAYKGEQNSTYLAKQRAQVVAEALTNRFGIDPKRIEVQSKVSSQALRKVDIYLAQEVEIP